MSKRREIISSILGKNDEIDEPIEFDKNSIIADIKENLPEPWIWFTVQNFQATIMNISNPSYDLLITKRLLVSEQKTFINQLSAKKSESLYNITLGIRIIDGTLMKDMFDELVTQSIQVGSSYELFDLLEEIDMNSTGIRL